MLLAALVLALVAFMALVYYLVTAHFVALVILFIAAGTGLLLFIADCISKWTKHKN